MASEVWYIPHHAVYHKRKKTLQVVFDCSTKFQQASLNDELFQAPEFLAKPDTEWPNALKDYPPIESNDPEVRKE